MKPSLAVVGGGIVGLAHAWSAAERGWKVTLLERHARAQGATVRNFGMVWPIGQPAGRALEVAKVSRARWLQFSRSTGFPVSECGSIHLAHRPDEWEVLQQFAAVAPEMGYDCELLGRDATLARAPGANSNGLLGGLFSPMELGVDPARAASDLATWLTERHGVTIHWNAMVGAVTPEPQLHWGIQKLSFDRVLVCSGSDFADLFPQAFAGADLRNCKLQMLETGTQPGQWRIGPHLASGLTLRHYANFQICPGLKALARRINQETPELDRYGIHVMASQPVDGRVILGDSHEYGEEITPFDQAIIEDLMVRELRKVFHLPDWTIRRRWHGIYAKYPAGYAFRVDPMPGVSVCTGTGGSGMTMAFGIAEEFWNEES